MPATALGAPVAMPAQEPRGHYDAHGVTRSPREFLVADVVGIEFGEVHFFLSAIMASAIP